ncbi:serine hydrolase [Arthrobacter sp. SDTb3-6]|uniref:serine hydrolase domain-containing protein n=1 Tax=Arthrobacter sp. SDTb3-6 TaxID=2713571 RepID=UPI00159D191E|nr:serine hydrolase [Arthrobacter sp. SDTb3-6]NVM98664.1 serine hydrolase [Arthrobacter sp. SDTb3-6]
MPKSHFETAPDSETRRTYWNIDDSFRHTANEIAGNTTGTPALAWAVVSQGAMVHVCSTGETALGNGHRPDVNTVFRIASLSKSFAAATTLLLERHGLVDLEAPVANYLPGLVDAGPSGRLPTLNDVLSMSGGFPSDDAWADRQETMTSEAFDRLLAGGTVRTTRPRQTFQYSNLGYAMIGRIVETVTGQPYPEVVGKLLFGPLGLQSTTFDHRTVPHDRFAHGYRLTEHGWKLQKPTAPGAFSAIGGVLSSLSDMGKWVSTLAASTLTDDGPLPSTLRRRMQQPITPVPFTVDPATGLPSSRDFPWGISSYGLGIFIEQDPDFGLISHHVGGYPGYGAHMCWHQSSGTGVIALGGSTYAPVSAPAGLALKSLLKRPLDTSLEIHNLDRIVAGVRSFMLHGEVTAGVFSPCVALDRSWQERRDELAYLKTHVGPLAPDGCQVSIIDNSRLKVRFHGPGGVLAAGVLLTPVHPRRVQVLALEDHPARGRPPDPLSRGRPTRAAHVSNNKP